MFSKHMALVCPPMSGFPAASSSSRPMLLSYLSHRPAVRERRSRARPASPVTLAGGSRYPISIASDAWGRRAVAGTFSLPRSLLVPEPRSGGGTIIARWRGVGQGGALCGRETRYRGGGAGLCPPGTSPALGSALPRLRLEREGEEGGDRVGHIHGHSRDSASA